MSKHDDHFFNVFSAVLGILVAITIAIFGITKIFGGGITERHVVDDPLLQAEVVARIKPFGQVAVAGEDNAALAIAPPPSAGDGGAGAAAVPTSAEDVYAAVCAVCHAQGIAGAPKTGDKAAWSPRIAQGADTLHKHAIEGYQGPAGYMPPKGGRADLSDESVIAAVDYMIDAAR